MTVPVANHRRPAGRLGRMRMSHMVADSEAELVAMARALGLRDDWKQPGRRGRGSHYDVCMRVRREAIKLGAVPISVRQLARLRAAERDTDLTEECGK